MPAAEHVTSQHEDDDVLLFLATLGSALSAIGETVDAVEARLGVIARSYGLHDARFSAFPTFVLLTLGQGKAATMEDILAIVASIASVALGVLCGVEFHAWLTRAGGRVRRLGRTG